MAQMPIQLVSGRAQTYLAPPRAIPGAAAESLPATQASDSAGISGGIPGGALRPGAIEQKTFRQRMAELNRADPPPGGFPRLSAARPAPAPAAPGIPTLTPAQLAALGVDVSGIDFSSHQGAPGTVPAEAAQPPQAGLASPALSPALSPGAARTAATESAPVAPAPEVASAEERQDPAPQGPMPQGPMPGARLGEDGVWELPRQPGKDERAWLQGMNATWRLVENPDSVRLFLGADGKFGFDDLLDIVNPLQHIPLVNIAYRALTGDTIDGAAQLFGAVPFGPLSVASNVTDLAFRSETGAGMAENGLAMIFGGAPAGDEIATAAGRVQTAEAPQIRRGSNR